MDSTRGNPSPRNRSSVTWGVRGSRPGPHVCFRVAKNGKYVNPIQLPTPEGPPLPEEFKRNFQARRDTLLASLDSGTLVVADEAL